MAINERSCVLLINLFKSETNLLISFFHFISDVKINTIPYEVEELIKRLDEKRPQCKNWRDVGRKLGVSVSDLNLIKREDDREGGSPTTSLLSNLCTWENIISLRKFVQTLHDLKRHDIVNAVIEFYKPNNGTNA